MARLRRAAPLLGLSVGLFLYVRLSGMLARYTSGEAYAIGAGPSAESSIVQFNLLASS